jgi:5-methylcytosine-specific restriction endonuclease McrA
MSEANSISDDLARHIEMVTNKRARFVLDAIAKDGLVTTEQINQAGYEHPPRAVRDARELGFPILTTKVKHSNGRSIAAYVFPANARFGHGKDGRRILLKKQRDAIIEEAKGKCRICGALENPQVDHRVPFEVGGEPDTGDDAVFQVLCGSCNRKKSWSCEHCQNWAQARNPTICSTCYWAGRDEYEHIAMQQQRRVDLVWQQEEVGDYEKLREKARMAVEAVPEYIKQLLRNG